MTLRTTSSNQRATYAILSVIIGGLIILIGWFTYLLLKPSGSATTTNQTTTNNTNKNKNNNKTTNKNTANISTTNTNTVKSNTNNSNSNAGLVEPDSNTNTANANTNKDNNDGTKTITLYFPKDTTACGVVYAVERKVTPSDDFYGQVVLEDLHGPSDTDTGYTTAIPSELHLREVRYSSTGPIVTVNEAFDTLSDCDKKTVTAQLVKTANAMFDLPESTEGQVVVGTVSDTNTTDSNTNGNTSSGE